MNALVRLAGGAAAVPAFREQLAEVSGRRDIEFFDLAAEAQHVREVADFEATRSSRSRPPRSSRPCSSSASRWRGT